MTKSSLSPLLLLALACSVGTRLPRSPRGQEVLQVRGALKGAPFRLGEADLASLRQGKVRGVDPVTGRDAIYEGVDLGALLDRLDPSAGVDTLVVRTADRRAVAVPFSVLRELRPVLAGRAGGAPLEGGRLVAWPNVAHHGLTTDPRASLWWARDVVALEYVAWARVFGRALRLPEGAPAGALAGANAFASRCLACHRIRQAGGGNGPDLAGAGPVPTVEKLAAVLPDHPGWTNSGTAPGPEVVPQLAAFLGAVARTPAEDVGDLEPEDLPRRRPPTF
jgi:mono/diheme cytochrome c family protein